MPFSSSFSAPPFSLSFPADAFFMNFPDFLSVCRSFLVQNIPTDLSDPFLLPDSRFQIHLKDRPPPPPSRTTSLRLFTGFEHCFVPVVLHDFFARTFP